MDVAWPFMAAAVAPSMIFRVVREVPSPPLMEAADVLVRPTCCSVLRICFPAHLAAAVVVVAGSQVVQAALGVLALGDRAIKARPVAHMAVGVVEEAVSSAQAALAVLVLETAVPQGQIMAVVVAAHRRTVLAATDRKALCC